MCWIDMSQVFLKWGTPQMLWLSVPRTDLGLAQRNPDPELDYGPFSPRIKANLGPGLSKG